MKAYIVVGMGYGDEGKGITTDLLCSKSKNPVNIRFSGGQQAGHTVVVEGVKHTFSNFGAGTFRGVPTYFTGHTTFYPTTIAFERKIIQEKTGVDPTLVLHPLAKMTTPYDVMANSLDKQCVENGTCGLGIGKTMARNEGPYKLFAVDLMHKTTLMDKLLKIKERFFADYGTDADTPELNAELAAFISAIYSEQWLVNDYEWLTNYSELIFEGSQGVLLDMDHGVFPNVTYANTTSKNAHEVLDYLRVYQRHMYYVTRAYHTRHGGGVFENRPIELINNEGETNVRNEYQGAFKTGEMDYSLLNQALRIERIYCNNPLRISSRNLVVTCLDQVPEGTFEYDKVNAMEFNKILESRSPDSKNITYKKI